MYPSLMCSNQVSVRYMFDVKPMKLIISFVCQGLIFLSFICFFFSFCIENEIIRDGVRKPRPTWPCSVVIVCADRRYSWSDSIWCKFSDGNYLTSSAVVHCFWIRVSVRLDCLRWLMIFKFMLVNCLCRVVIGKIKTHCQGQLLIYAHRLYSYISRARSLGSPGSSVFVAALYPRTGQPCARLQGLFLDSICAASILIIYTACILIKF